MELETLRREVAALKTRVTQLEGALGELQAKNASEEKNVAVSDLDKVILDVGGTSFATTMATLRKVPDSMLSAMFSGEWTVEVQKDGSVFFDRNPLAFGVLLQFLREYPNNSVRLFELPADQRTQLKSDAQFFGIAPLLELYPYVLCGTIPIF